MPFTLEEIVPWGRSFDEYVAMFALSDSDLKRRILGCGDGPAAFNAAMRKRGRSAVSVDPFYAFTADAIRRRIDDTYPTILRQLSANQDGYVWTTITSPEHLGRVRMEAMRAFLEDYDQGRTQGRYVAGELPHLPFDEGAFDLALCSHLLFTYSEHLSAQFHLAAVAELCRVAKEVRLFPLLEMNGRPSRHLPVLREALSERGYRWEVRAVDYEFQRGANAMATVRKTP